VAGGWRRLHNEELRNLYTSPNIIGDRIEEMGGACSMLGEMFGNPEGRRPVGRPVRRWKGNIRMDITKIGWEVLEWLHLAQDRDR
jgi:hypothetical protein